MAERYYAWVASHDPKFKGKLYGFKDFRSDVLSTVQAWFDGMMLQLGKLAIGELVKVAGGWATVLTSQQPDKVDALTWNRADILPAEATAVIARLITDTSEPVESPKVATPPSEDRDELWSKVVDVQRQMHEETAEAVAVSVHRKMDGNEIPPEPIARISLQTKDYPTLTSGAVPTNTQDKIAMDFPAAELVTLGEGQIIAVLDTGCDRGHPCLAHRVYPVIDCTLAGTAYPDMIGHGTAVVSQIVADQPSGTPIGTARMARIVPIRVLNPETGEGSDSTLARGVKAARLIGADIILMCWGSQQPLPLTEKELSKACAEGIVLVAAAGNDGTDVKDVSYPARYSEVLAVGSCLPDGTPSSYSTRGPKVDVYATGDMQAVALAGGGFSRWSGTSMAAPHVAAALAMWRAVRKELGHKRSGPGAAFPSLTGSSVGAKRVDGLLSQRGRLQAGALVASIQIATVRAVPTTADAVHRIRLGYTHVAGLKAATEIMEILEDGKPHTLELYLTGDDHDE